MFKLSMQARLQAQQLTKQVSTRTASKPQMRNMQSEYARL
jgi:hypothetical protein